MRLPRCRRKISLSLRIRSSDPFLPLLPTRRSFHHFRRRDYFVCPIAVPYPPVARPDVPLQEKSRRLARLSPPLANKRRNPETTSSQRRVVASTGAANQSAERAARSSSVSLAWRPTRPKIPRALGSVFFYRICTAQATTCHWVSRFTSISAARHLTL